MAYEIVNGIVIRYVNYKDHDRILSIFTQERGRIDANARGCRKANSPLLPCAQPFVYGEFRLYAGKSEHYGINQCDVREAFYPLREDIHRFEAACAMLTLTQQAAQEGEPNLPLFSLLYHGLSFLSYGESHTLDIALCFTLRFLQIMGICPSVVHCAVCADDLRRQTTARFSAPAGGALCDNCLPGYDGRVSAISLEAMRRMLVLSDADMSRVRLPALVRRELFTLLEEYCAYHLEKQNKPLSALSALL